MFLFFEMKVKFYDMHYYGALAYSFYLFIA